MNFWLTHPEDAPAPTPTEEAAAQAYLELGARLVARVVRPPHSFVAAEFKVGDRFVHDCQNTDGLNPDAAAAEVRRHIPAHWRA